MYQRFYANHRVRSLSLLVLLAMLLSLGLAACQPQAAPADSGQPAAEEADRWGRSRFDGIDCPAAR